MKPSTTMKRSHENYEDEQVITIFSEVFQMIHKYVQLLKTDRKGVSKDQPKILLLTINREPTNKIASLKKNRSDDESKKLSANGLDQINQLVRFLLSLITLRTLI